MDENNNVMSNGVTPETSTPSTSNDYVIGGPAAPVAEPASTVETTPVAETVPAAEPTPVAAPSSANIYEQANSAAINPTTDNKVADTPIYTTTQPAADPMASYSVPAATTYASTGSTSTNTTYTASSTYSSTTTETTTSTGMAMASLILGIISIVTGCCCCGNVLFSIAGIVCGVLQKPLDDGKKPGTAIAGIITSAVGIVMALFTLIAYVFLAAEA